MTRPQVLLLPPLGHDSELFAPLTRELHGECDVHALDYPGFGGRSLEGFPELRARAPHDAARLKLLTRLVDDVVEQLDALGVVPDAIGGVSLGGTLCYMLRDALPQRPRHLFLMASGGRRVARVRRETVRAAMDSLGADDFAQEHLGLDESAEQHYGRKTQDVRVYRQHLRERVWSGDAKHERACAAVTLLDAALSIDCEDAMRNNDVPALVLAGALDRIFNPRYVARYASLLSQSETLQLVGVGHYPPLEAPAEVAEQMRLALFEPREQP